MLNLWKLLSFLFRSSEKLQYSRGLVILVVTSGVLAGLTSTALLALINQVINDAWSGPGTAGWVFIGLCALLPLARFASQALLVRLAQGISFDLRLRLSRKILAAPYRRLEEMGPSRVLATLTDDIGRITGTLTSLPVLCLHITVVVSLLFYLGWLSWTLLIGVLVAVVVGILSYRLPLWKALQHFREGREGWDELFKRFRGITEGAKELKLHRKRRQAFLEKRLEPTAEVLREHAVAGGTIYALVNSWGQVLFFLLIGAILFLVPDYVPIDRETTTGFTLAILYMLTPLDVIMNRLPALSRAVVAVDKVESLGLRLGEETALSADPDEEVVEGGWSHLELDSVRHTFRGEPDGRDFTLGPVDLSLEPQQVVLLVGGNGSGKTTLAKLLIGLYEPEEGRIRVDGEEIGPAEREEYRQMFSVVFSDFFLFETLLGLEDPDLDEQAKRYLAELRLDHKVEVKGGELSTIDLSGGQRKRLALVTAYLEDRSIYVFDEWASDQDPEFKHVFFHEILPELRRRGKTVVAISHEDRYFGVADRIVKMEDGKKVYDGPAEEFLEKGYRYAGDPEDADQSAAVG